MTKGRTWLFWYGHKKFSICSNDHKELCFYVIAKECEFRIAKQILIFLDKGKTGKMLIIMGWVLTSYKFCRTSIPFCHMITIYCWLSWKFLQFPYDYRFFYLVTDSAISCIWVQSNGEQALRLRNFVKLQCELQCLILKIIYMVDHYLTVWDLSVSQEEREPKGPDITRSTFH